MEFFQPSFAPPWRIRPSTGLLPIRPEPRWCYCLDADACNMGGFGVTNIDVVEVEGPSA
jgi:hypothetical protein